MPTSPRGIIPTPTRRASALPIPSAPRPQPINFGALLAQGWGFPELLQVIMVDHHGQRPSASASPVGLIQTACRMADWLGFPEFTCSVPGAPLVLPQRILDAPQLEPTRLRDLINKQAAILGS
jgi:hypothetical protein